MQKNIGAFILICAGILAGWFWLQHELWPPRPRDQQQAAKDDGKKQDDAKKDDKKKAGDEKDEDKKDDKVAEVKQPEKKVEDKGKPEPPPETVTLGGPDTHLQVLLTTRGAGVQKLTLTRFQAADYLGQPAKHNLDLIQEDPYLPSFLMYHFPDAQADHPVLALGEKNWTLEGQKITHEDGTEEIKFSVRVPGQEHIKITKTYRLGKRDYHLGLFLEIERDKQGGPARDEKFRYQLAGGRGLPIEGEWYTSVFRKAVIGLLDGRGNLDRDLDHEDAFQISHMLGGMRVPGAARAGDSLLVYAGTITQYFASVIAVDNVQPDKNVRRNDILAWARPTLETTERRGRILEINGDALMFAELLAKAGPGNVQDPPKYELLPHVKRHIDETGLKAGDQVMLSSYQLPDGTRVATWVRRGQSPRAFLDDITVRVNSEEISLNAGDKVGHQFMLYHGPVKVRLLSQFSGDKSVDPNLIDRYTDAMHLSTLTDYRSPGVFGTVAQTIRFTPLLIACTKLMHWLLFLLNHLVFGSYGLSIILLTVLVRGLMFPISKKQAMYSIRMQELAPKMKELQEKYKNDPQGRTQATMELYRKHNVHPLGACLPMLMQLPIFLGLYYALQESIHFRLASFLWMDNLAAPDMLIWWSESIPWVSDPDSQGGFFYLGPYFNLLPLFAVGLMFVQQKMMTPPPTDEQQAIQQKTFQFMMIFMGIVFYKVAAGLCIYFIASSLWGVAERQLLPKKKTGQPIVAASPNGKSGPPEGRFGKGKGKGPTKPASDGTVQKVKDWWAEVLKEAKKK